MRRRLQFFQKAVYLLVLLGVLTYLCNNHSNRSVNLLRMKKLPKGIWILSVLLMICRIEGIHAQIIADHTVVDKYDQIPQQYIDKVKEMWVIVAGESHSKGYRIGCRLLEELDPRFQVNIRESGAPEGYTNAYMRLSSATWGDLNNSSGWIYSYGEEDWFTNATALTRTRDHLTYCNNNNLVIAAMGFGWCWDMTSNNWPAGTPDPVYQVRWAGRSSAGPEGSKRWGLDAGDFALTDNSVCMDTYLSATDGYNTHCIANGYPTKIFYTTGPVDANENLGENGYQRFVKHEYIRNFVKAGAGRILFDYADILCWNDAGERRVVSWTDFGGLTQEFQAIHADNLIDLDGGYVEDGDHIGEKGAVRLAKALWWMLARMAGWDGQPLAADARQLADNTIIYPVPAKDFLVVETGANTGMVLAELFDIRGNFILAEHISGIGSRINLNGINPGVYLLRITAGDKIAYRKVIRL